MIPLQKTGSPIKPKRLRAADDKANFQWWLSPPESVAHDMLTTARRIAERQSFQREQHLWHARLHGGIEIAGLTPTAYSRPAVSVMVGESIGLNVIENMCSAAQAEICANKPKATFATDEGDWYKQEQADKLTRYCEGQNSQLELYALSREIVLDACIFGTGILKTFEDEQNEEPAVERVFPWELLVDNADGLYGRPRCMYQTKYVDRALLVATYPEYEDEISRAQNNPIGIGRDPFIYDSTADLIQVVEAWRLPNRKLKKEATDEEVKAAAGRHVIAIDGVVLLDEPWRRSDFPFSFLRWVRRPFGFWGKGLAEQLAGIQKEINRLLLKIQRAFARLGITRVFIERGSKVNTAHIRANDGDIIEYTGQRPVQVTDPVVSPEIFGHLWKLEEKAYNITGISQMTSQGQAPPPGVDSGRAIRTLLQNHSKRLNEFAQQYEEFFLDVDKKLIAVGQDIAGREVEESDSEGEKGTRKRGYSVKYSSATGGTETIDLSEVDLEEDDYVMRPYPTSALPSNPGEKMQVIQDWFNTGMIDGDKAMMLMDFPDTREFADMNPAVAMYRAVMRRLTDIVKKGKPWVPDSFIEPAHAKALAVPFLLHAEMNGAPEDRLDLLRQCIEDLIANESAGQPAPPAPIPGGGAPQLPGPEAGPLAPQVSPIGPMANPMQPQAA